MRHMSNSLVMVLGLLALSLLQGSARGAEWNPVRTHPVQLGPQTNRLLVGFKATAANSLTTTLRRSKARPVSVTQAQTSAADALGLTQRSGLNVAGTRQITPSMHVLFLAKTLYGNDVEAALN